MKFLKDNIGLVGKLLVNQVALALFGLMVGTFVLVNSFTKFFGGAFTMSFYWFLIYNVMWSVGGKARIAADTGREPNRPYHGFLIGCYANAINFVLAVLNLLYVLTQKGFFIIGNIGARLLESMYIGWWQLFLPNNPAAHFLIIVPSILVTGMAYFLGYRNFYISSLFGVKRGPDGKVLKKH